MVKSHRIPRTSMKTLTRQSWRLWRPSRSRPRPWFMYKALQTSIKKTEVIIEIAKVTLNLNATLDSQDSFEN